MLLEDGFLVDGIVTASKLDRRMVLEARMRANVVVMLAPSFNDDDRYAARTEPLDAQAFVAEFAVEALVGPVLPRLFRIDERRLDALLDRH